MTSNTAKAVALARCACGSVELEASGAPIICAACHCADCREGARRIEELPGAASVQEQDGGTAYVLYRKDRVRCLKGASLLKPLKIKEASPTNRVVATCCNSAMLLDFDDGKHWVDVYRSRLQGPVPPLRMRICVKPKPTNGELSKQTSADKVPSHAGYPFGFIARLLGARLAMLLWR